MTRFSLALAVLLFSAHHAIAAPPAACGLMAIETASQAYGSTLKAGVEQALPMGGQQCTFYHEGQGRLEFSFIDEVQLQNTFRTNSSGFLKMMQQSVTGKNIEAIPSLGDFSSYAFNGIDTYTLTTIYHGKVIYLNSVLSKNPGLKASLVQTMRQTMQKF